MVLILTALTAGALILEMEVRNQAHPAMLKYFSR